MVLLGFVVFLGVLNDFFVVRISCECSVEDGDHIVVVQSF